MTLALKFFNYKPSLGANEGFKAVVPVQSRMLSVLMDVLCALKDVCSDEWRFLKMSITLNWLIVFRIYVILHLFSHC